MNFPESSLANLSSLGYTEDEARFLYVVATHSGYFSMRQFLQFTGTKSGDKSMTFSQKLFAKGHATARSFLRNSLVYHLFSRIVYRAIGRENLRNRRAHSLEHIRTRLVYISPRPTQFEIARKTFLATAGRPPKKDPSDEILRYFRLQKLWDERKYGKLTTDDREFLHLSDKRYARHRCQRLYPSWRDGIVSDDYVRSEIQDLARPRRVIFESELVDGQVALFEATPKRKPTPSTAGEVKNSQEGTFGGSFGSAFAAAVDKPMEK